jgi:hypothetical protein
MSYSRREKKSGERTGDAACVWEILDDNVGRQKRYAIKGVITFV